MKANRRFKDNEEAVSAVIGVILMVAITVAIAATVYVYVSGMIGGTGEQTPSLAFTVDSGNDKIVVASADYETNWNDVTITDTPSAALWAIWHTGGSVNGTTGTYGDWEVLAGDYIVVWGTTGNVDLSFRYEPTNSLMGTWTVNV